MALINYAVSPRFTSALKITITYFQIQNDDDKYKVFGKLFYLAKSDLTSYYRRETPYAP